MGSFILCVSGAVRLRKDFSASFNLQGKDEFLIWFQN
jgi:hypothetical protein